MLMATSTAPNNAVTVNIPTFLMTIGAVVGESSIKVKNTKIQELPYCSDSNEAKIVP